MGCLRRRVSCRHSAGLTYGEAFSLGHPSVDSVADRFLSSSSKTNSVAAANSEDMCKNLYASTESYDFCITTFQVERQSRNADINELAVIGIQLSFYNHSYNLDKAKELHEQPGLSNRTKQCIDVCIDVYEKSLEIINNAMLDAEKKWPFSADMTTAGNLVSNCEQAFDEVGETDLLATENINAFTLDSMMIAIDALLHPHQ